MPVSFVEQIASPQNILWAWFKVKNALRYADTWVDELAIWEFELRLDMHVESISSALATGVFRLDPIKPLPQLKALSEDGQASVREYFWISIKDQVAWMAVVNVIGEFFEKRMPCWSYGNRIHRRVWVDRGQSPPKRRFGPFRKSSSHVYRPFPQMWSLYRRHAYLTIRAMAGHKFEYLFALDEQAEEVQKLETTAVEMSPVAGGDKSAQPLEYLSAAHWRGKLSAEDPEIWFAYIDLARFYPSLEMSTISNILIRYLSPEALDPDRLTDLLNSLSAFHMSSEPDDLALLKIMRADAASDRIPGPASSQFNNLPTGLIAGGFLANAAMLPIDEAVASLTAERGIAHFRYVDDHIVLALSADALLGWVLEYQALVKRFHPLVNINADKVEPATLRGYLKTSGDETSGPGSSGRSRAEVRAALTDARIDIRNPVPFLTSTISKMSAIQRTEPLLLEKEQLKRSIVDLEQFLLVDIPEQEIPKKSRVAFATTKLIHFFRAFSWDGMTQAQLDKEAIARLNRIVTAIHEFPGRKVLWQKALRFCREFCIMDLTLLKTEYESLKRADSSGTAHRLLAPYLVKLIGDEISVVRQLLEQPSRGADEKLAPLSHVSSLLEFAGFLQADIDDEYYAKKAGEYFSISCWLLLREAQNITGGDEIRTRLLERSKDIQQGILRPVDTGFYEDPALLCTVVYWVDQAFAGGGNGGPSSLWQQYLDQCRSDESGWLRLAIRYPYAFQEPPRLTKRQVSDVGRISLEAVHAIKTIPRRRNAETIHEVAARRREWLIADAYDPRAGEWTALKWLEQIVARPDVEATLQHWSQVLISVPQPHGFAAPKEWRTWAASIAGNHRAFLAAPVKGVHLSDVERLRTAGLILLGLLRNSFVWPPSTYYPGAERDSGQALQKLILDVSASTLTTRILRACLVPQQLEPVLLKEIGTISLFYEEPIDGDTFYLRGLPDLVRELRDALSVLERGQMAVGEAKPRQLVPVNLFLLGKNLNPLDAADGTEGS
jgi:hypothetical protein